ncbi:hypothetical protein NC796_11840 [Aliifodinibius sp. S!AR15-10]|uniref:hypothetical protein n=1 Tax=Aliifodinibius sp. S!AR15-10 TaxID=2950437 RepID=UPI002864E608|nr:hypothetical protein [Aliifodinibius sp. S!AR15-10]MDR8391839.1 hypothetical protein [Aliifodinibius sp. S!AR15-10]
MKPLYFTFIISVLFLAACEQPNSPDFKVNQKIQTPLMSEKTYQFLGGSDALVDSTDPDFEDFFSSDDNGLVRLTKDEDFNFGNLDDAIPEVDVNSKQVSSQVGELALGDFSSQGDDANLGSTSFQDMTGYPAPPAGTEIPEGETPSSDPAEISISGTDYFVSATIKNGNLVLVFQNDLGLDLDDVTVDLFSGSTFVASGTSGPVNDTNEGTVSVAIPSGTVLQNLNVEVSASWSKQDLKDNSNTLIVEEVGGENLVASQVEAALDSQDFYASGTVDIDDSNFQFTKSDHYIELESGQLTIDQIVNQIDLTLDTLQISFPDIRTSPYNPADSLVIKFEGSSQIQRSSSTDPQPSKNRSLSGLRIFANGNAIDYNIKGVTEQTKGTADEVRTLNESDGFSAEVGINNLAVKEASGVVMPREVIVNDDVASNGTDIVDLFNNDEAQTISINALSDISDQLDGIEFNNPELSISYLTNIGVPTTIYASIMGTDASGNRVYLKGKQSGSYYVSSTKASTLNQLRTDGTPVSSDQLIKFEINATQNGTPNLVTFNKSETNVDEFLNNLPSDIRLISLAAVNESSEEGTITDPVEFNPAMSVDIPLNLTASAAVYRDTVAADLSDLPDPEQDDRRLTEGTIYVNYTNNLPLGAKLKMIMLDSNGDEVTRVPSADEDGLVLEAASVDNSSLFVNEAANGNLTITLNEDQLNRLNRTSDLEFEITLNTSNESAVRIKAEDTISLKVSLSTAVESTVN